MSDSSLSVSLLLQRLWGHLESGRKTQLVLLLLLMMVASFAEMFSIGAVLPFLSILIAPDQGLSLSVVHFFSHYFHFIPSSKVLFSLTLIFIVAAITAGMLRLLLLFFSTRISFAIGADLSGHIYERSLYQPYAIHVARNSSEIISAISTKANNVIYSIVVPALTFVSSMIMLVAVLAVLLAVNPIIALVILGGFGLIYIGIILLTRRQLAIDSESAARKSNQLIKILQEGLGAIRDVLIDSSQPAYCQIYRKTDLLLREAQGRSFFIGASPRYVIESLGIVLIASVAYIFSQPEGNAKNIIPILGALALGAQRLLPILQQAYGAWSAMHGGLFSLKDTLELLDQPMPENIAIDKSLAFDQRIDLKGISFRYQDNTPLILNDINLSIAKGSRVGFIGVTGSGKSTLLDIIMGLLTPISGVLSVDGQPINESNSACWWRHIAHVPQSIYLTDATIAENIAFSIPKDQIDFDRVCRASSQSQLANTIESWPDKYETLVGERGVRLSGGQRQRIGIARALYKQASVIVLDEATSALDNETEQAVMDAIEDLSKDLTVLIIAHRLTTLRKCMQVVELSDGKIKRVRAYQDICNSYDLSVEKL